MITRAVERRRKRRSAAVVCTHCTDADSPTLLASKACTVVLPTMISDIVVVVRMTGRDVCRRAVARAVIVNDHSLLANNE
jgi:hypothetical protein